MHQCGPLLVPYLTQHHWNCCAPPKEMIYCPNVWMRLCIQLTSYALCDLLRVTPVASTLLGKENPLRSYTVFIFFSKRMTKLVKKKKYVLIIKDGIQLQNTITVITTPSPKRCFSKKEKQPWLTNRFQILGCTWPHIPQPYACLLQEKRTPITSDFGAK